MAGASLFAQEPDLFDSEEPLTLELLLPMDSVMADRFPDAEYRPGLLFVQDGKQRYSTELRVRATGNFRLDARNCRYPPLKLRLPGRSHRPSAFAPHKRLKLILPCSEEEYVQREYLVYRAWALISDYALRVRPVRLRLRDSEERNPPVNLLAFLVEDDKTLAKRSRTYILKSENDTLPIRCPDQIRLQLFQYMIGNTDWDLASRKNLKLLGKEGEGYCMAVPYDFDWCEAVGADYTFLEGFEQRRFLPLCCSEEELRTEILHFLEQREAIVQLFGEASGVSGAYRKKMKSYLSGFFDLLEDEAAIRQVFPLSCD